MNNLELMRKRLLYNGGISQESRMIEGKRKTLDKVLLYSYQACTISKIPYQLTTILEKEKYFNLSEMEKQQKQELEKYIKDQGVLKALINPDKLKQDYDDKILSAPYEYRLQSGDIIKWNETNSYWLVYLQELTEDAYFRSEIRRCQYVITWIDENGKFQSTWCAIRGPVETKINTISKGSLMFDTPNLTLNILLPLNEDTIKVFKRYYCFLFKGKKWQVQTSDDISIPGVINVTIMENYINLQEDDVEKDLVKGLLIEDGQTSETQIQGNNIITPLFEYNYQFFDENASGTWSIVKNTSCVDIVEQTGANITLKWKSAKSGDFILQYTIDNNIYQKTILVQSLL